MSTTSDKEGGCSAYAIERALSLFEDLLAVQSVEELHRTVRQITTKLGFEHFLYGGYVRVEGVQPVEFILSGYPEPWMEQYKQSNYIEIDPIVAHCIRGKRQTPLVWNEHLFEGKERLQLWEEARAYGLQSGISLPLHVRSGEDALFSVANPTTSPAGADYLAASLGMAQLLANYTYEVVRRLVLDQHQMEIPRAALTEREQECLTWAAAGKTAWETAAILTISERTVRFHLDNVIRKLGVNNRRQAVARAVSLGLVHP
ncbi:LuxR family transcriptional regulator [Parachitinimonas caeni]|uniref:LuxR family transcriptional regulator n=1 Tax=Parachitinimonas caeni TaxID=3031301 RepID=A0ABT7E3M8_9NEIS|nr:LuxR family transcriptional regulator [Parachitinimonas caeni]MDK2125933.1 LuxR family transcriptional regulator [Parachitinimonas caeni]